VYPAPVSPIGLLAFDDYGVRAAHRPFQFAKCFTDWTLHRDRYFRFLRLRFAFYREDVPVRTSDCKLHLELALISIKFREMRFPTFLAQTTR